MRCDCGSNATENYFLWIQLDMNTPTYPMSVVNYCVEVYSNSLLAVVFRES